jgi:heptosyltransferase III
LGDFLVTLPALALLRAGWPAARIEFAGNALAAALALSRGLIDAAHSQGEARWATLFASGPLPEEFAAWLAEFDLVVNFWPDADGELQRRFPRHDGQRFLTASATPARAPAAAHYCEPLRELGLFTELFWFPLESPAVGIAPPAPIVAIHPGSGSPRKNWPIDRWVQLCECLISKHGAELHIISGETEAADVLADFGRAARNLPLPALTTELARCQLFVGHDSGVSHLAVACSVPSVLLFGPTDPAMWAPPAPHVRVLRHGPDLTSISVSEAQAAVLAALSDQT